MNRAQILAHLKAARTAAAVVYAPNDVEGWWPAGQGAGDTSQSESTSMVWGLVARLALDAVDADRSDPDFDERHSWSVAWHADDGSTHWQARNAALRHWNGAEEAEGEAALPRKHWPHEILVDHTVSAYWRKTAGCPIRFAAESEMCESYDVGPSMHGSDGYTWDFYKLLLVHSPRRLMVARVGARTDGSQAERLDKLQESLDDVRGWYGPTGMQEDDQLACVLLPAQRTQRGQIPWNGVRIGVLDDGKIRWTRATDPA